MEYKGYDNLMMEEVGTIQILDICNYFYYSILNPQPMSDESERKVKEEEREEIKDETHEIEDIEQDEEEEKEKEEEEQEES